MIAAEKPAQAAVEDFGNPFQFCDKYLECGHTCKGVKGESECLPCLKGECIQAEIDAYDRFIQQPDLIRNSSNSSCRSDSKIVAKPRVLQSAEETNLDGICFTTELRDEPCVRLICGHVFHANCVLMILTHKWSTTKISFGYLNCPSCTQEIIIDYRVPILTDKLIEHQTLKAKVLALSLKMAFQQGLDKKGRVVTEGDIYFGQLADFAMHSCTIYECF